MAAHRLLLLAVGLLLRGGRAVLRGRVHVREPVLVVLRRRLLG